MLPQEQPLRPGALVQVVDILGHQQQLAWPCGVEPRQSDMRRIGLDRGKRRPASIVESVDQLRIARIGLGRAHVLDAMSFPQAVRPAECGDAALGRDARAGQDHDVSNLYGHSAAI